MIYLHNWEKEGFFGMVSSFSDICISKKDYESDVCPYRNEAYWIEEKAQMAAELEKDIWQGVDVILASYSIDGYEGEAFVLFRKNGNLYEVNGGHCSCYRLEGQWQPEPITIEALRHRLDNGTLGKGYDDENIFADELRVALDKIDQGC